MVIGDVVTAEPTDENLRFALEASREIARPETALAQEALADLPRGSRVLEIGLPLPPPLNDPAHPHSVVHVGEDRALLSVFSSSCFALRASSTALPFATSSVSAVRVSLSFLGRADERQTLAEVARVTAPRGLIAVTALLRGTFVELADLLVEAAEQEDLPGLRGAVLDGREEDPDIDALAARTREAGFDIEQRGRIELMLSYRDGAAVVQDPFVRATVLPMLLPERDAILLPPPVLSRIARAVDTYFDGQPFNLSVHVGVVRARRSQS